MGNSHLNLAFLTLNFKLLRSFIHVKTTPGFHLKPKTRPSQKPTYHLIFCLSEFIFKSWFALSVCSFEFRQMYEILIVIWKVHLKLNSNFPTVCFLLLLSAFKRPCDCCYEVPLNTVSHFMFSGTKFERGAPWKILIYKSDLSRGICKVSHHLKGSHFWVHAGER